MPRRVDQDFEDRRQQIIDGALAVFSQKGFEKATNKDIARAAGIGSPGLIYHYFKDKADLFRQVLESHSPGLQMLTGPDLISNRPPHEVLNMLGQAFLASLCDQEGIALFRIMLGEAIRRPTVAAMLNNLGPSRAFTFLTPYLSAQMDAGLLRRTDPAAATLCFIGPLLGYVMTREIFPQPGAHSLSPETMVAITVETFLRGMDYQFPSREPDRVKGL